MFLLLIVPSTLGTRDSLPAMFGGDLSTGSIMPPTTLSQQSDLTRCTFSFDLLIVALLTYNFLGNVGFWCAAGRSAAGYARFVFRELTRFFGVLRALAFSKAETILVRLMPTNAIRRNSSAR